MINCIGVSGEELINKNSSYKYTVYYENIIEDYPVIILLSYNGSSLTNGIDFTAPNSIIIPAGQSSETIVITTHTEKEDGLFIQIIPSSSETDTVCENIIAVLDSNATNTSTCAYTTFFWEPYKHSTRLP